MPRSIWKPDEHFNGSFHTSHPTKTRHARGFTLRLSQVGQTIGIPTGKTIIQLTITDAMLGKKLGEFALTRKLTQHTKKGKKKKG